MLTSDILIPEIIHFAAIVIGIVNYRYLSLPFRIFTVLLLISFFLFVAFWLYPSNTISTIASYFYQPIDYSLFAWIFYCFIRNNIVRRLIVCLQLLFIPVFILNYWIAPTPVNSKFTLIGQMVENVLLVFYSLVVLNQYLKRPEPGRLVLQPPFWLSFAVLIFSTNIFFASAFFVFNDHFRAWILWKLIFFAGIIFYSGAALSLLATRYASNQKRIDATFLY
jgi:hypothetical protein